MVNIELKKELLEMREMFLEVMLVCARCLTWYDDKLEIKNYIKYYGEEIKRLDKRILEIKD